MGRYTSDHVGDFYARTYDAWISDWPGEIEFYKSYAVAENKKQQTVLELACGTGRVAIPIAMQGVEVVGLDHSPAMLEVARKKSAALNNIHWVLGDMRSFALEKSFDLIIIPGHAFQNLITPEDQAACLEAIHEHLSSRGTLIIHIDHQSMKWLGELVEDKSGKPKPAGEFIHPETGQKVQVSRAWSYEPATQTAIAETFWDLLDDSGEILERLESGPIQLHCAFRFEIEHLLVRCGFAVESVFGDFLGNELLDDSEEMVWVAGKAL